MRDKIPLSLPGNGISAGLLHWASSCGTRSPTGFLRAALLNGHGFCCLDNIPACEGRFGNPRTALRRRGKSSRAPLCVVSAETKFCPPDKHSDRSPADKGKRSVAAGSLGWLHVVHTACSPENRSVAWPFSRYSLAWCSHHLLRSFIQSLFQAIHCWQQLRAVIGLRCHGHSHNQSMRGIRGNLSVVTERETFVRLLHHPRLRITSAHPRLTLGLFSGPACLQLLQLSECTFQPLLLQASRTSLRLLCLRTGLVVSGIAHRRHLLSRLLSSQLLTYVSEPD